MGACLKASRALHNGLIGAPAMAIPYKRVILKVVLNKFSN